MRDAHIALVSVAGVAFKTGNHWVVGVISANSSTM
jgi:hypothetical protein